MSKAKAKKQTVGYELRVQRKNSEVLESVGTVFGSRHECHVHQQRFFKDVTRYVIVGVRLSVWKLETNAKAEANV